MEGVKIFDAEWPLMQFIWDNAPVKAAVVSHWALQNLGWKPPTTYTVIGRLIRRGVLERNDPSFIIKPIVSRMTAAGHETNAMINKLFRGSRPMFISCFLQNEKLTKDELDEIRSMIERYEKSK